MSTSQAMEQKKIVTFLLNDEFYGIEVNYIREVFVPESITPIPKTDDYVAGVINFRGLIVTVIDLKRRLLIEERDRKRRDFTDDDLRNYVLIVNIGKNTVGLLVDYVEAVLNINTSQIQSSVDMLSRDAQSDFISGIVKSDLGLIILVKLESIFSDFDIKELQKLASARAEMGLSDKEEVKLTGKEIDSMSSKSMTDFSLDDLSDDDDVIIDDTKFTKVSKPKAEPQKSRIETKTEKSSVDEFGDSPLDLAKLTKAELLRIAIEMGIDTVSTKSTKDELITAINSQMG
jgi:purine-binding chemotaxis protein CheW